MDHHAGVAAVWRRGDLFWGRLAAVTLAFAAWQLGASIASAQGAPVTPLLISSTSPTPLLINGLASDKLPVGAYFGTEACVPTQRVYVSEGERYTFQKWSDGTTDTCLSPKQPGEYRALYNHEVLLVIKSDVRDTQSSQWVTYGVPVPLDVPPVVQDGNDSRYRFQSWSDGETPFQSTNTIAPVKPTILQVSWLREHQVTVESPDGANIKGSGWYADGANLVLRAPDTLPGSIDQERYKFTSWVSDSFPAAVLQNAQTTMTALKIDAAYTVKAVYTKQYQVVANSPFGQLKNDWVNDGDNVVLEAPATSDIVADRDRLVFKRWDGLDGLISPKITGKVDKPINVTAVYDRQVMVAVSAPHGAAGDGWQKVGSIATISVPSSYSEMFLLNSRFLNFGGYPSGQASIQVLVNEPTTLTALYRTEPNYLVLTLILLLPLLAVIVHLGFTRGWFARWRARAGELRDRRWAPRLRPWKRPLTFSGEAAGSDGTHLSVPVGEQQS